MEVTSLYQKELNFDNLYQIASRYILTKDISAAYLYYQKALEVAVTSTQKFDCIIMMSNILHQLGSRERSVRSLLSYAITEDSTRPETYYLLAKMEYDKCIDHDVKFGDWISVYSWTRLGIESQNIERSIIYPGIDSLKAMNLRARYQLGLNVISELSEFKLEDGSNIDAITIYINLFNKMGIRTNLTQYDSSEDSLRIPIKYNIASNISSAMQDVFALTTCVNNTFIEFGSSNESSNIITLESVGFSGIHITSDSRRCNQINLNNVSTTGIIKSDELDYTGIFVTKFGKNCGYLSIQEDLDILKKINFNLIHFDCVTITHLGEAYDEDILLSHGYELLCKNVRSNYGIDSDDWWISREILEQNPKLNELRCNHVFAKNILIE